MTFLSFYLEINKGDDGFFTHDKLNPMDKIDVKAAFVGSGGYAVKEMLIGNKRFIISKWNTVDGYDTWMSHPASQAYILARDAHNKLHNIQSEFITVLPDSAI